MDHVVRLSSGRDLELWSGGAQGGHPVVFHPGCPDSRLAARTGEAHARSLGLRLVSVNRPGYGRSTPAAADHLSVAADVLTAADELGLGPFSVLGMSVGGPYALALAARASDRVTGAALVGSPAVPGAGAPPVDRGTYLPDFEAFVSSTDPQDADEEALAGRWAHGDPVLLRRPPRELAEEAREALATVEGYLTDAVTTFSPWAFAPEHVPCPVSLWYGEDDRPDRGAALAARIPDSRLTVLPTTGHLDALLDHWPLVLGSLTPGSG